MNSLVGMQRGARVLINGGDGGGTLVDNAELVCDDPPESAFLRETAVLMEESAFAALELHDTSNRHEKLLSAVVCTEEKQANK